jgi:hypothetical protein
MFNWRFNVWSLLALTTVCACFAAATARGAFTEGVVVLAAGLVILQSRVRSVRIAAAVVIALMIFGLFDPMHDWVRAH